MNKFFQSFLALMLGLGMLLAAPATQAQYLPPAPAQNAPFPALAVGPAGAVATVSGLTVSVSPGPLYCNGNITYVHNSWFTLQPNQVYFLAYSCLSDQLYVRTSAAMQGADYIFNVITTNASGIASAVDQRVAGMFPLMTDASYIVPFAGGGCTLVASTGALGSAATGTTNPGPLRTAANATVYELITSAATNVVALDCDITPPTKLTTGKGVTINNVQIMYGVQTTALTSITAPTISTDTYPATGAAAGVTTAAAGGALTVTPGVLQLATTTSGQCYSENIVLGTPITVNTDLQRVLLEQLFNQSAAAATQLQICGVIVHYTNLPL